MTIQPFINPFQTTRPLYYSSGGGVTTSHPVPAAVGLELLRQGGNAVDAAVAAAIALVVCEPTSNGFGSDCFAILNIGDQVFGLNASGWSPQALTLEELDRRGMVNGGSLSSVPSQSLDPLGWQAVTVPGAMAGWHALIERFGTKTPDQLVAPLISILSKGIPTPPGVSYHWANAHKTYSQRLDRVTHPEFHQWFNTFAPGGKTPQPGDLWSPPDQITTLKILAKEGFLSLYQGTLAQALLTYSQDTGGFFESSDLTEYVPQWVEPISTDYRGAEVLEIPPNGQGITALMALGIRSQDRIQGGWGNPEDVHFDIEALKLAFVDSFAQVADPGSMVVNSYDLLNPEYLEQRRQLLGPEALDPRPGNPPKGGTVYLSAADSQGNMVSFIQSNYMGFGSGLVVPGYGISLQNRGHNFSLQVGHPNQLAGRKRPYHTIIPGFLTEQGKPLAAFGVMGGFMQPQGHMQVVKNLVDYELHPQAALDAPRWQWLKGKEVTFEQSFPNHVIMDLKRRGHQVSVQPDSASFGRGQIILKDPRGVYSFGSESRCDSLPALYFG